MPRTVQTIINVVQNDLCLHGDVRSSKYWDYVEAAENDFFRCVGIPEHEVYARYILPRIAVRLDSIAPAYLDDALEITTHVSRISTSTFNFAFDIKRQDTAEHIAKAEVVICCVDEQGSSRPLPDELLAWLQPFLAEDAR